MIGLRRTQACAELNAIILCASTRWQRIDCRTIDMVNFLTTCLVLSNQSQTNSLSGKHDAIQACAEIACAFDPPEPTTVAVWTNLKKVPVAQGRQFQSRDQGAPVLLEATSGARPRRCMLAGRAAASQQVKGKNEKEEQLRRKNAFRKH